MKSKSRASLAFCVALLFIGACEKKTDRPPAEPPKPEAAAAIDTHAEGLPGADDSTALAASRVSDSATTATAVPEAPIAMAVPPRIASRPALTAYPGKTWQYRPTLSQTVPFTLRLLQSPDSSMRLENGSLIWTPGKEGRFPVALEAMVESRATEGAATSATGARKTVSTGLRQDFTLTVERVLILALKPLPAQAGKGDTILFDLRGSAYPAWAADRITVRFDYQGDGTWDTDGLPLASHLLHRYAYDAVGRFTPKVEARYADLETRTVQGEIAVISPVMPVLKLSPDTLEPGGMVTVDVSASKGDGALAFVLDLNGDGKPDWADSTATKTSLKGPGSGSYTATLTARNSMGQEGKTTATLRVNSRPRLELKVKNPKDNMTAAVEFKVRAKDADDSLAKIRFNFNGDAAAWETRASAPDSVVGPGEWWLRFKHAYGKPGSYTAAFCVTARDGREACQQAKIEIFNAPPVCLPGADLKATLGKPLEIDGGGEDPDGKIVKWEWDLDGDGKFDLVSAADGKFQYTFSKLGIFPLTLRVTSADGATAKASRKVEVRKKWKS